MGSEMRLHGLGKARSSPTVFETNTRAGPAVYKSLNWSIPWAANGPAKRRLPKLPLAECGMRADEVRRKPPQLELVRLRSAVWLTITFRNGHDHCRLRVG